MRRTLPPLLCASVLLLGATACSDDDEGASDESSTTIPSDGPTTLVQAEAVELVGEEGLAGQTLDISAQEDDGEVTGEFQVSEVVVAVDCANTDIEGFVILGGEVTTGSPGFIEEGDLLGLIIRDGDPDGVALTGDGQSAASCAAMLESIPDDLLTDASTFTDVEAGSEIETS